MPSAGQKVIASDIDTIEDETIRAPIGRLVQTVAQTGVASATITAITFTTEDVDSHSYHDTGSNTSRATPTLAGWYRVNGSASLVGATDYTIIEVAIRQNGATVLPPATRFTPNATSATLVLGATALVSCNGSTDYFEVIFRATKGAGTISTVISSQFASVLEWEFVRPL